jgi:uncharacterized protein with GYD domain
MALYVTLYNFTDQGVRGIKDSPARLKAGIDTAAKAGMKVLGAYYTQGPYDLVIVSEATNEDAATAFALGTAALGNVRSVTMRAWDPDAFASIVSMIP